MRVWYSELPEKLDCTHCTISSWSILEMGLSVILRFDELIYYDIESNFGVKTHGSASGYLQIFFFLKTLSYRGILSLPICHEP